MDDLETRVEELLERDGWVQTRQELAQLGRAAVPVLIARVRRGGPEPKFTERAVLALGEIGGEEAEAFLVTVLGHEDPILRAAALTALRQSGNAAHAAEVANLLGDEQASVRKEAIKTLAEFGDETGVEPLKALARSDEPEYLREQARAAVEEIKKRRA